MYRPGRDPVVDAYAEAMKRRDLADAMRRAEGAEPRTEVALDWLDEPRRRLRRGWWARLVARVGGLWDG